MSIMEVEVKRMGPPLVRGGPLESIFFDMLRKQIPALAIVLVSLGLTITATVSLIKGDFGTTFLILSYLMDKIVKGGGPLP